MLLLDLSMGALVHVNAVCCNGFDACKVEYLNRIVISLIKCKMVVKKVIFYEKAVMIDKVMVITELHGFTES
jgi:hypothetical protein